ncbi:MAG: S9 family peptidase [Wenzhouxiangellaceae bacterium]|nr:S9 family peptidase [Wenzhouxiangellaceae bacterium]
MISRIAFYLLALPALVFALSASAGPLEVRDIFGLEYADSPRISPDGRQIVYLRRHMDTRTDRNVAQIWLIGRDGKSHQPLTEGKGSYANPVWSPDGERIAFTGHAGDGDSQLHVLWLESGRIASLTDGPDAPSAPSWSPDGTRIAFNRFVRQQPPTLVEPLKAPEGANWAPPPTVIDRPVFRIDGRGFLPHGQLQRFVVPASGGPARQLTDGPYPNSGPASWSADGRSLVFSANRRDDWELESRDTELFRLDLESGDIRAITERYGPDQNPAVSPDGKRLAWLGFDDELLSYANTQLYVMPIDGDQPESLTADLDRNVDQLAWSDDGRHLYISYADQGLGIIERVDLDGRRTRVAEGLGGTTLGRPYASGDFDADGEQLVYTHTTPSHPADLVHASAGGETRLTRLNAQLLGHRELSRVEEIRFPSSHDQLQIQGWVAYPPGYEQGRSYPLILEIHGGPFADYGPRFSAEIQLLSAAGYVVAYLNPRGSTSYGAEFANRIHHAYPGHDYDDLISGVDYLIDRGVADPDQLYVTGGSGGGVLSAWIIGKTDRFRAAAVVKPVINWTSFVLTGDMTPVFHKYWFPALPWEAPEHYFERSPLSLAGNVTTPTMIMTGEADWRTPMWESEQFYQALKLRGVDSILVRIPEAPHSIAARPSQLVTKIQHILAWFDRHAPDRD